LVVGSFDFVSDDSVDMVDEVFNFDGNDVSADWVVELGK